MKYDDASCHFGGDFPKDLPIEAGATHTGMFFTWACQAGLAGELDADEIAEILSCWATRSNTPGNLFLELCDGKFTDEDLDEEGNTFAREYFDFETGQYIHDYESLLALPCPGHMGELRPANADPAPASRGVEVEERLIRPSPTFAICPHSL